MLGKSINKKNLILYVLVVCLIQINLNAWAEQSKSPPSASPSHPGTLILGKSAGPDKSMDGYKKLKTAPQDFPDLPVFNGKCTFTGGYFLPDRNGTSVCQMNYVAEEKPSEVLDFYKNAFAGNGWKILYAGGLTVSARHKDGHICSVNVSESKLPKMKSQFTIAYRQLSKQR